MTPTGPTLDKTGDGEHSMKLGDSLEMRQPAKMMGMQCSSHAKYKVKSWQCKMMANIENRYSHLRENKCT